MLKGEEYNENSSDLWMIDEDDSFDDDNAETENVDDVYADSYDVDGDGQDDLAYYEVDTNGDSMVDAVVVGIDIDGDNEADVVAFEADLNYDGTSDYMEVQIDAGNGTNSIVLSAQDDDFDGDVDKFSVKNERDYFFNPDTLDFDDNETPEDDGRSDYGDYEDSEAESEEPSYYDDDSDDDSYYGNDYDGDYEDDEPAVIIPPVEYDDSNDNGTMYYDLENFDPADSDPDKVIGDPEEAMERWEYQGNTNRCAVYSQKFVIEEYTGEEVDIDELVDVALENNWFTESGGTLVMDMDKLLDYYGVPNEASSGNDINDLAESLSEGKKVIVALDADEYWSGENDDGIYTPGDGINHAVEVIGIDYSDPDNPTVILNDSGCPNGQGVEIPMETFIDAWEDGDCYMIECM